MTRLFPTAVLAVLFTMSAAVSASAQSIDETINSIFASSTGWFVNLIFSNFPGTSFPWIVGWLVIAATVFTVYFGVIQFRAFGHAIALVKGDYSDPNDAGEVSHFQALATALSGTVGLGNIAGVAVAIGIGGPGATFWMILAGLLGMASKFTECTLGVKYRNEYPNGTVSGGPMYYLTKGFSERGMPGGRFLAIMFSIFCILGALGGGNMFQANQAHAQLVNIVGDYALVFGHFGMPRLELTGAALASILTAIGYQLPRPGVSSAILRTISRKTRPRCMTCTAPGSIRALLSITRFTIRGRRFCTVNLE